MITRELRRSGAEEEADSRPTRPDRPKTFREVAQEWLSSHQGSWAEWTYRKFKGNLESRVFSKIGDLPTTEITPKQLRQLREQIIAEGKLDGSKLTNRSVNRIMQPVTAIFNELFGDGEIQLNPASRVTRLKEKRIAEIDPFSNEEVEALLKTIQAVHPHYLPYVDFLFASGFRPNEVNGLKWSNVNFVSEVISVRSGRVLGKDKDPKTEKAIRDAEITPEMMEALRKQKSLSYLAHSYVFVSEKGRPIDVGNFRARVWEPALKKAGLKYRYPYQTRHTFATKYIMRGADPLWIAKQMGTSSEMIFKHYAVYIEKARSQPARSSVTKL